MADPNPLEEALGRIEVGIRQLKIQYDMYFAGAAPRQPYEVRKELETQIKTLGDTPMQRFSDRYRYNSLASKYQTMVELWGKMLRAKEEGRLRPGIPGFVEPVRRPTAAAGGPAGRPGRTAPASGTEITDRMRFTVSRPAPEDQSLRMFYDRYVELKWGSNGSGARITYERFCQQLTAKTETIRQKAGCETVTYTLEVKGDGVSLKAVPVREGGGGK